MNSPGGGLLEEKGISKGKAFEALLVAFLIVGGISYTLHLVSFEMEEHFHIFNHTLSEDVEEFKAHPAMLLICLMSFPILTMIGLALVIPLGPYVFDHAAFQSMHVVRPDHFLKVVFKVYSAWIANDGKLKAKDL